MLNTLYGPYKQVLQKHWLRTGLTDTISVLLLTVVYACGSINNYEYYYVVFCEYKL